MLVLLETSAGYAILKFLGDKVLLNDPNLHKHFITSENASKIISLLIFEKFENTTEALTATNDAIEGKLSKKLTQIFEKFSIEERKQELLVYDSVLGKAIFERFGIKCTSNKAVQELIKCILSESDSIIGVISKEELVTTTLALAHSFARQKLNVVPEKTDTMVIESVRLLNNIEKEITNYLESCRKLYNVHFPELAKIVKNELTYAQVIKLIGLKERAAEANLSKVLPEHLEEQVKFAAQTSIGIKIEDEDVITVQHLCEQILKMAQHCSQLIEYIDIRMKALAPNFVLLTGSLLAARLLTHAGSFTNLAKMPASTIQILGSEKYFFKALKTNKNTPKYGMIYHAPIVEKSNIKNKGKMAKKLAGKIACACRVDAFREHTVLDVGVEHAVSLEDAFKVLEENRIRRISGAGKAKAKLEKYLGVSQVVHYDNAAAAVLPLKRKATDTNHESQVNGKTSKIKRVKKK